MNDDDVNAFLEEMKNVDPIDSNNKSSSVYTPPSASPRYAQRRKDAVLDRHRADGGNLSDSDVKFVEPHDYLEWKLDGVQPAVFRRLQEGGYEIRDSADLHGLSVEQARKKVWRILIKCKELDYRCIRIVHGRGIKSEPPAQLKSFVFAWLKQHKDVIAVTSAPPNLGGTGAVLVKIRKSRRAKQANREAFGN